MLLITLFQRLSTCRKSRYFNRNLSWKKPLTRRKNKIPPCLRPAVSPRCRLVGRRCSSVWGESSWVVLGGVEDNLGRGSASTKEEVIVCFMGRGQSRRLEWLVRRYLGQGGSLPRSCPNKPITSVRKTTWLVGPWDNLSCLSLISGRQQNQLRRTQSEGTNLQHIFHWLQRGSVGLIWAIYLGVRTSRWKGGTIWLAIKSCR